MNHCSNHDEFVDGCFGCKLKTLQWGMVPGAARMASSKTYWDRDLVLNDFGDPRLGGESIFHRDNVEENRLRVMEAIEDEG